MELVKDTPVEVGWFTWPARPPRPSMTVVVKATFALAPGELALADAQEVVSGERYVDDDVERSLERDTDLAPYKAAGECFVLGACHPPAEARTSQVAFQIGGVQKHLAVFGDRTWTLRGASEPALFRSMPLSWERAFGGADNPVGRRVAKGEPLPNLEDPQRLLTDSTQRPPPACTAPIARTWPLRARDAGTYDASWLAGRYPALAEDLGWAYFNAAPPDQRIQGFWRGDEEIVLVNLVEGEPSLRARLPGITPRAFLTPARAADPLSQLWELALRLDTVTVDGEARTVSCLWRGVTEVGTETLDEMGQLFVTVDPPARRSVEACREALGQELARRKEEEAALEAEAAPQVEAPGLFKTMLGAEAKWSHLDQALTVEAGGAPVELMRELAAKMRASGMALNPMLDRFVDPVPAAPPLEIGELEELEARLLEEERDLRAGVGLELRRRVQRALMDGESCAGWDLRRADLSRLNLSGGDFREARFTRANLAGAIFGDTSFEGALFVEAELSDASFHGASFEGAQLTLCRLERAHFGDSTVDHAAFVECFLREARFTRSYGRRAELSSSHLTGVTFQDSVFDGADFTESELDGALFARTSLIDAWMPDGVTLRGARFERCDVGLLRASGSDLSGAVFAACVGVGARFAGASCPNTDFSFSELDRADFSGAVLTGAKLMGCRLRKARFDAATMGGASLVRSDLFQARLEGADLRSADLRGASLFQAEVYRARLEGAQVELADMSGTRFAR